MQRNNRHMETNKSIVQTNKLRPLLWMWFSFKGNTYVMWTVLLHLLMNFTPVVSPLPRGFTGPHTLYEKIQAVLKSCWL